MKGRSNFRGRIVHKARLLSFESLLEHDVATILMADRRVTLIEDQPPAIRYCDETGRAHRHTFDFRVTRCDGVRLAVVVKPSRKADTSAFKSLVHHLRETLPSDFADGLIVVTERDIHPARVADARLILAANAVQDPEADAALARAMASLERSVTIQDLRNEVGLGGRGFGAIIRALRDGRMIITERFGRRPLQPTRFKGDGRIDAWTMIARNSGSVTVPTGDGHE